LRSFARYWLPPLLWTALIWGASSDLGSADNTAGPVAWFVTALFPWATAAQIELVHGIVRKCSHLTEYAILAALWFRTFYAGRRLPSSSSALAALALTIAWAIIDEVHQSFVPSRTASALDVLVDSIGAALVLFIVVLKVAKHPCALDLEPRIEGVAKTVAE
jgi:VanZ family protein